MRLDRDGLPGRAMEVTATEVAIAEAGRRTGRDGASTGESREEALDAEPGRAGWPRVEMTAEPRSVAAVGLSRSPTKAAPAGPRLGGGGQKSPTRPDSERAWQGRWFSRETLTKASCGGGGGGWVAGTADSVETAGLNEAKGGGNVGGRMADGGRRAEANDGST